MSDAAVAEALLSGRADAIIAADRAGIIRFWNPGAERLFGYARREALEQSLNLIIPEHGPLRIAAVQNGCGTDAVELTKSVPATVADVAPNTDLQNNRFSPAD